MNDTTLNELKIVVERSVRPIKACLPRKRQMREELLAHLTAIFEEEAEKIGDDHRALDQAKRRFGDPSDLTAQLQNTVPFWDRTYYYLDKWGYQPGESMLCCVFKFFLSFAVAYGFLVLVFGIPSLLFRGRQNEIGVMLHIVFYTFIAIWILCNALLFLAERLARAFFLEGSKPSLRMKVFYSLMSFLFCPVFAFLCYWTFTGDFAASLVRLRIGCYMAPATPLLFLWLARQMAEEIRYKRQWASLNIDE